MGHPGDMPGKPIKHRFFVPPSRIKEEDGGLFAEPGVNITHHMRNVLRLSAGAKVALFDNTGNEYWGEVVESKPKWSRIRIDHTETPQVESPVRITLAQSLIKGNAFDRVLTMCTEAGCARFVPLFTRRTVVKLNKAAAADRVGRWEKVVREASAQCGRVVAPVVEMPMDFSELLEKETEDLRIILYERGGKGQLDSIVDPQAKPGSVLLLAGPEGGFETEEVDAAVKAGFHILGLGPRLLKAETAGVSAISILQHRLGDMG